MPETRSITVYPLAELTGTARETALNTLAQWNTDDNWWEFIEDDTRRLGALFGLTVAELQFSGFSSQGDGASITGSYRYVKGGLTAIQKEAPTDETLHAIVSDLTRIQRLRGYRLTAEIVRTSHHYSHENTVTATAYDSRGDEHVAAVSEAVTDVLRRFMRWVYRMLETEYEYRTSEAALLEFAEANEYRFLASGSVAPV